jgi:hypothetical protein
MLLMKSQNFIFLTGYEAKKLFTDTRKAGEKCAYFYYKHLKSLHIYTNRWSLFEQRESVLIQ